MGENECWLDSGDHSERLGSPNLRRRRQRQVLDAKAWLGTGMLPLGALEGVQGLLHGPVAQAMNRHLQAALVSTEHQVIDLILRVVPLAEAFLPAAGMVPRQGIA